MHLHITHIPGEVRVVFELSCLYSSDLRLVVCIIAFHRISLLESFKGKKNTLGLSSRIDGLTLLYDQKAIESCDIRRSVSSLSEAVRLNAIS